MTPLALLQVRCRFIERSPGGFHPGCDHAVTKRCRTEAAGNRRADIWLIAIPVGVARQLSGNCLEMKNFQ